MYDGQLISSLLAEVESTLKRNLPRTGYEFDDLCIAKVELADKMAAEIYKLGYESPECRKLWLKANTLQNEVLRK
jgi:hypothetical protein